MNLTYRISHAGRTFVVLSAVILALTAGTGVCQAATEDASEEGAPFSRETVDRLAASQYEFGLSGETWREPVVVTVTFSEPEARDLYEAEVPVAHREAFLRSLLEEQVRRGNKGAAYVLALCRLSGALGEHDLPEALRLAEMAGGEAEAGVLRLMLWRVLYNAETPPPGTSVLIIAERLAEAEHADAAVDIATAGARVLPTGQRDAGLRLILRAMPLAQKNPKKLESIMRETVRSKDAEAVLEVVREIEATGIEDEGLRRKLAAARIYAALRLGRLEMLDAREMGEELKRAVDGRVTLGFAWGIAGFALAVAALFSFLTRKREAGPGWLLSLAWAVMAPLGLLIVFVSATWAAATAALLLTAMLAGLSRPLRNAYFSPPKRASWMPLTVGVAWAVSHAAGAGYFWLMNWLGHEPPTQVAAMLLVGKDTPDLLMRFLLFALLIPVLEEVAFRGHLQNVAARRMSRFWATVVIAALFGLMHGWFFAPPLILFGIWAAWLRERHESLWAPILLHVLNNSAAFAYMNLVVRQ